MGPFSKEWLRALWVEHNIRHIFQGGGVYGHSATPRLGQMCLKTKTSRKEIQWPWGFLFPTGFLRSFSSALLRDVSVGCQHCQGHEFLPLSSLLCVPLSSWLQWKRQHFFFLFASPFSEMESFPLGFHIFKTLFSQSFSSWRLSSNKI